MEIIIDKGSTGFLEGKDLISSGYYFYNETNNHVKILKCLQTII